MTTPRLLLCLLVAPAISGCTGVSGRVAIRPDPLYGPGSPVGQPAPTRQDATLERPPANEATESAVHPAALATGRPNSPTGTPVSRPPVRLSDLSDDGTPTRAASQARYDHSPDYRRLCGRIDRPYCGGIKLRFCDASHEDRLGGCVFLTSHPTLKDLPEGAWVEVRGTLLDVPPPANRETIYSYPSYEVQDVRIVGP